MKIICLCGSPKGPVSVTMQYVKYLELKYPQHEFVHIHAAQQIHRLEKNMEFFDEIMEKIKSADFVLWAFPLYILHVHGNFKRFIELIFEFKKEKIFEGKYCAAISSSINFYDNTAHNYINAISDDLGMKYIDFFSAHMNLLTKSEGRKKLLGFAEYIFNCIDSKILPAKHYDKIDYIEKPYLPGAGLERKSKTGKKVAILADNHYNNLDKMIERFKNSFADETNLYYLSDVDIKGGCLGCLKCGPDNKCAYDKKDGLKTFFNDEIKTADIIVFAGKIRDRYLSSEWKTFLDRLFFNTHQKTLIGKQVGFLISGPLWQLPDLKENLTSYFEFQGANVVDFVSDEPSPDSIDNQVSGLAERLTIGSRLDYIKPATFRGIAGMKIFRDEIYGSLKVVFKADHKNYKKTGLYDFPQRNFFGQMFSNVAYWVTSLKFIEKKMYADMPKFMIMNFRRAFSEKI